MLEAKWSCNSVLQSQYIDRLILGRPDYDCAAGSALAGTVPSIWSCEYIALPQTVTEQRPDNSYLIKMSSLGSQFETRDKEP